MFVLLILRERAKAGEGQKERERERERERESQAVFMLSSEPNTGLKPKNHEIMTWAEIKSQTLNRLSHPDAPNVPFKEFWKTIQMQGIVWMYLWDICWPTACFSTGIYLQWFPMAGMFPSLHPLPTQARYWEKKSNECFLKTAYNLVSCWEFFDLGVTKQILNNIFYFLGLLSQTHETSLTKWGTNDF